MQRRRLLQLGVGSAAVLALAGGSLALLQPGLQSARLSSSGREVLEAVGRALLHGSLPATEPDQAMAVAGLLDRIDALVAGLPAHAQTELSQLLALLAAAPGRLALAGLRPAWEEASIEELQQGLQAMRVSSLALRQQAYQAMHDIVGGAYFSEPGTWSLLDYPGPTPLP